MGAEAASCISEIMMGKLPVFSHVTGVICQLEASVMMNNNIEGYSVILSWENLKILVGVCVNNR